MKQTQENFVSMSSTTMKVLDNNGGTWSSNVLFFADKGNARGPEDHRGTKISPNTTNR